MKKLNAVLFAAAFLVPSAAFALPQPKVVRAYMDGRSEAVVEIAVNRGFETAAQNGGKDRSLNVTVQASATCQNVRGSACFSIYQHYFSYLNPEEYNYGYPYYYPYRTYAFNYPVEQTFPLSSAEEVSLDKGQAIVKVRVQLNVFGAPNFHWIRYNIESASVTLN